MLIHISSSNSKLGKVPNISLIPVHDCANCDSCKHDCYALKAWRMYANVRNAWRTNSGVAHSSLKTYFRGIDTWVSKHGPKLFRFHVAGDILSQTYLRNMARLARRYPGTKFLAFTKMHMLDYSSLPNNLAIVASMWPGMDAHPNAAALPKAWVQDGTEKRIPANTIECNGGCESCGMCWELPRIGRDVVFHKH